MTLRRKSKPQADHASPDNLKIGDIVLLFHNAEVMFESDIGGKSGFVLADLSGSNEQQLLTVQPAETSDQELPNLKFGTFKVLVSNKYEAQTRYRSLLEKLNESKRKKKGQNAIKLLQAQVTQAKRDGEVEQQENAAKQRRLQGSNVYYGDLIQLRHTLTGKYVCTSTTTTSITENTKLRVFLQRKDSIGCIFRLHPRIKVQTVGEEVNYDDQIKFESLATEGQYLHCSKKTFGDIKFNVFSDCYELNLAPKDSPLKIIHHYHLAAKKDKDFASDNTLKASGTTRFFHRKHQCYIIGEGSFVGHYGNLPEIEPDDIDAGIAASIQQSYMSSRRMTLTPSPIPKKSDSENVIEVKADVEPIYKEMLSLEQSIALDNYGASIDLGSQEQFISFANRDPPSPSVTPPDIQVPVADSTLPERKISKPQIHRQSQVYSKLPDVWSDGRSRGVNFSLLGDEVVTEDVHFQKKKRKTNLSSQVSTNPNTFWQIEKFNKPYSGEPMEWSEPCLIKHLPTRRYLAVCGNSPHYKVTLKSFTLAPSATIFELFPISQVGDTIEYESNVRVKHRDTGTWLHLNKDLRYAKQSDYEEQVDGEEPTDALEELFNVKELFKVVAQPDIDSDDAFILEKVDNSLVAEFNYVAGVTMVLTNQLHQCEALGDGKIHSPEVCHMDPALSSLKYLQYLLSKNFDDQMFKFKQKLLYSMKTLVLVIRLLNLHRNEESNDPEVCTACFGIISHFLEGNSTKYKSYVSQMIQHIFTPTVKQTELLGGMTPQRVLVGIAVDNPSVMYEKDLMERIIEFVIEKLKVTKKESDKNIQLLETLGTLCVCKGVAVEPNQNIVLKKLQSVFVNDCENGQSEEHNGTIFYPLRIKPSFEDDDRLTLDFDLDESHVIIDSPPAVKAAKPKKKVVQFQAIEYNKGTKTTRTLQAGFWYGLSKGSKLFHEFLVAQINLMTQMCKGDNTQVINVLQGVQGLQTFGVYINFQFIMSAMDDKYMKRSYPKLRSALLELLKVMYIEVGENRPFLEKIPLSFIIDEVGEEPFEATTKGINPAKAAITALTGVENPYFPDLREWIKNFFQDESEYIIGADEDDLNGVVVSVLQILSVLVKFGYYDDSSDVSDLLPSIHKLLNGSKDFPRKISMKAERSISFLRTNLQDRWSTAKKTFPNISFRRGRLRRKAYDDSVEELDVDTPESAPNQSTCLKKFQESGRYEYMKDRENYFEIKHWAMEVLNLIFNFQLYTSVHNFIYDFRWLSQPIVLSQSIGSGRKNRSNDIEMTETELKRPKKLSREPSHLIYANPQDPLFSELSRKAAKKVIASAKERLMYITERRDDDDALNYHHDQLAGILLDLSNYKHNVLIQQSLLLLNRFYTTKTDIFKMAFRAQLLVTKESCELYNKMNSMFMKLEVFLKSRSSDETSQSPIKWLTECCWLDKEVEGFEPHQINQKIILSFGIFPDVMGYVLEYCNGHSLYIRSENYKQHLIDCLKFLRAMVCKNFTLQECLLRHLDSFIKASSGELAPYIGELLCEVFRGGPSITLLVKDEQIWQIVRKIFAKDVEAKPKKMASFLDALIEFAMVRKLDLPLQHSQLVVVRFISLIREDARFWCKDLLEEGKSRERWEILASKDDTDPKLANLLMITDLLATCAFGENTGVDSVCCTIYSESELIEIISSDEIPIYCKRPFMKLLVWVYMNVRGKKAGEQSEKYMRNELLWSHMTKMAALIQQTSEAMNLLSTNYYLSVKELLISSNWKYSHRCTKRRYSHTPKVICEGEAFNLPDILLYISEGFFPFLQVFYSELYRKGHFDQSLFEGDTTNLLYKALLSFHTPLNSKRVYFSQDIQVRLYYRVVFLIKPHNLSELPQELICIGDHIAKTDEIFNQEVISLARERYNDYYSEEIELNSTFNTFVENYKSAYEGRNLRSEQIINATSARNVMSGEESYTEFLDDHESEPGPRYLPLGMSFQEHVTRFISTDVSAKKRNPKDNLLKQLEISLGKGKGTKAAATDLDTERQADLDIKCLQILRASIYNQTLFVDEEDKDRDPIKYRKLCEQHLHPIQNEIQDLGNTVVRVIPLISHPDERVVTEVLSFLEIILAYGNDHVQKGLVDFIKSKSGSHHVFPILKFFLNRTSTAYQESQLLVTSLKNRIIQDKKTALAVQDVDDTEQSADEKLHNDAEKRGSEPIINGKSELSTSKRSSLSQIKKSDDSKPTMPEDTRVSFIALYKNTEADNDISKNAKDVLKFYDLSRVTLISKVLGLMCDGQFREMQNYLRQQTDNAYSVNMVAETAYFLYIFSKKQNICEESIQLFNNLFQALNEFCIGNHENREVVFNKNIIPVINYILQMGIVKKTVKPADSASNASMVVYPANLQKMALEMKASSVQLLVALLEEISSKSTKLTCQIAEGLDIHALHLSMLDFYILKSDPDLIKLQSEDDAHRALFDTYKILMYINDSGASTSTSLKPTEKSILKAWVYCAERSRCIEIVYRNEDTEEEVLTKVHFNVDIKSKIREELKDEVKFKVDRSTHADKLRDFHEWMKAVKQDTLHHDWLRSKHLYLLKIASRTRYWLLLLVTLLINILFIIHFTPDEDIVCHSLREGSSFNGSTIPPAVYFPLQAALASLYAFLSLWLLLEYFLVTQPHFVLPEVVYKLCLKIAKYFFTSILTRLDELPVFQYTYSSINLFGVKTMYLLLFIPVFLSPFYCFGYFYCISFLYIIINNDILQRALQAVTKNGKSLLWVAILLLVIVYIYAVITFAALRPVFNDPEDSVFCQRLDECFISVLRFGLIDNFLDFGVSNSDDARNRFFYDISFFIIVTTIGLNIVFGIIVDTFSELRDLKFKAELDLKSTCFICGLPSHKFDKISHNGFQNHVKTDHNMWDYINYSMYLDQIDITDHNAIEKYVHEKILSGDINYLPIGKAMVLQGLEEENELKKDFERLEKAVDDRFSTLISRFDEKST